MTKTVHTDLAAYYAQRASTYEDVYAKPERQDDLAVLHERVPETVRGHIVLEIACGSGYWTERLVDEAASILATDINPECIALAQAKKLPTEKVQLALADAFDLHVEGNFSACFAAFWWSHVKRQEQDKFLTKLRALMGSEAQLVLVDNTYVEESSTSIARTDLDGNTFQIRTLPNGERHEVLKNFPTDSALRKRLAPYVKDIRVLRLEHYWMLTGRFK